VASLAPAEAAPDLVALAVRHDDGSREIILSATDPAVCHNVETIEFQGGYAVVALAADDRVKYLYLGAGSRLAAGGVAVDADEGAGACLTVAADGSHGISRCPPQSKANR
jgi:hypothetical protein